MPIRGRQHARRAWGFAQSLGEADQDARRLASFRCPFAWIADVRTRGRLGLNGSPAPTGEDQ